MITRDEIVAEARRQTGLAEIGDARILEGLDVYVRSLNTEAKLTPRGEDSMRKDLVKNLANRMRVEDWLQRHPELLERPVDKPMFVFGLPRTGTTLFINLLNADPARRCFLRWESLNSVPPPKAAELHTDPRCLEAQAIVDMSLKYAPHISAIHHEDGDSPTECQFSMSQSFCAQYYESMVEAPSYRDWFLKTSYRPAFEYHKRLLQLLQAEAPGRWTLKNPWHPLFLDDLTAVYPDAQLVMTHRDPVEVVGSACSLIKHVRAMFSDQVDLNQIGESFLDTFEEMIRRQDAFRARRGQDAIYDVQYVDVMLDPIGEIRKLYARFGEPFTPEAEAAMGAFLAENPKGKHGKHAYSLEEYGLSAGLVRERFADYCRRFDIPQKR